MAENACVLSGMWVDLGRGEYLPPLTISMLPLSIIGHDYFVGAAQKFFDILNHNRRAIGVLRSY